MQPIPLKAATPQHHHHHVELTASATTRCSQGVQHEVRASLLRPWFWILDKLIKAAH
jgi:hypothetical protein